MSIFQKTTHRCLIFLLLILLAGTGCMRQDALIETGPPLKYLFPETPADLLTNFVTAYTTRDVDGYAALLHEDFLFSFQACDVQKLGLSKDHFTREEEIQTARHMFAGVAHKKADGSVVPAITEIRFDRWEQPTAWRPAKDSAAAGVMRATVQCQVTIEQGPSAVIRVSGQSIFYATPAMIPIQDGIWRAGYKLLGWVDLTGPCGS